MSLSCLTLFLQENASEEGALVPPTETGGKDSAPTMTTQQQPPVVNKEVETANKVRVK